MKIIGIYKITSPSNKIYIGQSRDIYKRVNNYYKNLHCKSQVRLYRSLIKYGWEAHKFEIIEKCLFEDLNNRERYWQDYYNVLGSSGLNSMLTNTNEKPRVYTEEFAKTSSERQKGIKKDPSVGPKISKAKKGKKKTPEQINKAKIRFVESKHYAKCFEIHKNKAKQNMRNTICKPVIQYDKNMKFIKQWECASDASKELKINNITRSCKQKNYHAGGFKWQYVEPN